MAASSLEAFRWCCPASVVPAVRHPSSRTLILTTSPSLLVFLVIFSNRERLAKGFHIPGSNLDVQKLKRQQKIRICNKNKSSVCRRVQSKVHLVSFYFLLAEQRMWSSPLAHKDRVAEAATATDHSTNAAARKHSAATLGVVEDGTTIWQVIG